MSLVFFRAELAHYGNERMRLTLTYEARCLITHGSASENDDVLTDNRNDEHNNGKARD